MYKNNRVICFEIDSRVTYTYAFNYIFDSFNSAIVILFIKFCIYKYQYYIYIYINIYKKNLNIFIIQFIYFYTFQIT